jgi:CoA-transferase family III
LQAQIFMLDFQGSRWLLDGEVPKQAGNNHPTSIPTGVFKTADGHINIAATGQKIWERFCKTLETPDLINHPDYKSGADRSKNRDALNALIGEHTVKRTGLRRPAGPAPGDGAAGEEQEIEPADGGPADDAVAHAEQARRADPEARRAHRRGAEGIRLQCEGHRCLA